MPPRIPTEADFAPLRASLTFSLHFPDPPETTTAILILLHGLGDTHHPFSNLAQTLSLPGVLAISVRAPHALPAFLLSPPSSSSSSSSSSSASVGHYHWGDDLLLSPNNDTGLDPDPGFRTAAALVREKLIRETLGEKLGWGEEYILLLGFGQGGSLALGLPFFQPSSSSSSLLLSRTRFKGIITISGTLPPSMTSSYSDKNGKNSTPVLAVQVPPDETDALKDAFEDVRTVRWSGVGVGGGDGDVRMPRSREEMLPIMQFFAERLRWGE